MNVQMVAAVVGWVTTLVFGIAWVRSRLAHTRSVSDNDSMKRDVDALRERPTQAQLAEATARAARVPELEGAIASLTTQLIEANRQITKVTTEAELKQTAYAEAQKALTEMRGSIDKDLKIMASEALAQNQKTFLQLAGESLTQHKQQVQAQSQESSTALQALLNPLTENLRTYQLALTEMEKHVAKTRGENDAQLKDVAAAIMENRSETSKLINAFRAAPASRGAWGEMSLRRVMELAQMTEHCDFELQVRLDGGHIRPDAVVHMPGNRKLIVDAKAPTEAYLEAMSQAEESQREAHLLRHVRQTRAKVDELGSKAYQDALEFTPEYVVMFIPGDNFFQAAAERDPQLFEYAAAKNVIITTPATLMALARAIAMGWRQEHIAEDARKLHAMGADLYKRIGTMAVHITKCGDGLGTAVSSYNAMIGSIERSVMPAARKLNKFNLGGNAQPIPELVGEDEPIRVLDQSRDNWVGADDETVMGEGE